MKKIILLLPLFVLLFGFCSKAESYQDVVNYLESEGIYINSNGNAAAYIQSQVNAANNYYNNSFGIAYVIGGSGSNRAISIGLVPKSYIANMTYSGGYWKYNNNNIFTTQCNTYYCTASGSSNNIGNYWVANNNNGINITMSPIAKYGKYDFVPPVDWENPYYSVAVPTPEYEVTYRNIGYGVDVPLNFIITPPITGQYYCEIMAEFSLANNLTYVASQRYFDASSYIYITKEVVAPDEYVSVSSLTANTLHTVLTNKWQDCLNELPMSSVSIRFPIDFTAEQITAGRDTFSELRENCTLYGSSLKFYIRYFTIEEDTKFVVGPWRIWDSYSPKTFNDELPSYYIPYAPASGNTGTSTSTGNDPNEVVIPVGGQTPTGEYYTPNINITVGNNVPNYPDYPTISSYNLDNLLVSTMNNAKGLTGFFGEFGGFLTASFAFIPTWIWAIIGVGFSLSIVVMFLKIL